MEPVRSSVQQSTSPIPPEDPEKKHASQYVGIFKQWLKNILGQPLQVNNPTLKDWQDLAGSIQAKILGATYEPPSTYSYQKFNEAMAFAIDILGNLSADEGNKTKILEVLSIPGRIFLAPAPSQVILPPQVPRLSSGVVSPSPLSTTLSLPPVTPSQPVQGSGIKSLSGMLRSVRLNLNGTLKAAGIEEIRSFSGLTKAKIVSMLQEIAAVLLEPGNLLDSFSGEVEACTRSGYQDENLIAVFTAFLGLDIQETEEKTKARAVERIVRSYLVESLPRQEVRPPVATPPQAVERRDGEVTTTITSTTGSQGQDSTPPPATPPISAVNTTVFSQLAMPQPTPLPVPTTIEPRDLPVGQAPEEIRQASYAAAVEKVKSFYPVQADLSRPLPPDFDAFRLTAENMNPSVTSGYKLVQVTCAAYALELCERGLLSPIEAPELPFPFYQYNQPGPLKTVAFLRTPLDYNEPGNFDYLKVFLPYLAEHHDQIPCRILIPIYKHQHYFLAEIDVTLGASGQDLQIQSTLYDSASEGSKAYVDQQIVQVRDSLNSPVFKFFASRVGSITYQSDSTSCGTIAPEFFRKRLQNLSCGDSQHWYQLGARDLKLRNLQAVHRYLGPDSAWELFCDQHHFLEPLLNETQKANFTALERALQNHEFDQNLQIVELRAILANFQANNASVRRNFASICDGLSGLARRWGYHGTEDKKSELKSKTRYLIEELKVLEIAADTPITEEAFLGKIQEILSQALTPLELWPYTL